MTRGVGAGRALAVALSVLAITLLRPSSDFPPLATAQDQTGEPPATDPLPAPTDVPPPAPTAAPPVEPSAVPPPAPDDDDDDDDRPDEPAPTEPTPAPGAPTRAPRPTRTPRTTPTMPATPVAAGALRLTLAVDAAVMRGDPRLTVLATLANRGDGELVGTTLDLDAADGLLLEAVDPTAGQTARSGNLVRWYIPQLSAGAEAILRLTGVPARAGGSRPMVCALVISAASPVEHCVLLETAGADPGPTAPAASALPTAEPAAGIVAETPGALRSPWALLVLGLLGLGVWSGLQWRSRRSQSE